jgi:hypothetical protein
MTRVKTVRVRLPLPDKELLKLNTREFAAQEQRHRPNWTPQDQLRFYIRCRERDIEKQELEILKAQKRIERLHMCIVIAKEAVGELGTAK